jgi:hypothetical protein
VPFAIYQQRVRENGPGALTKAENGKRLSVKSSCVCVRCLRCFIYEFHQHGQPAVIWSPKTCEIKVYLVFSSPRSLRSPDVSSWWCVGGLWETFSCECVVANEISRYFSTQHALKAPPTTLTHSLWYVPTQYLVSDRGERNRRKISVRTLVEKDQILHKLRMQNYRINST